MKPEQCCNSNTPSDESLGDSPPSSIPTAQNRQLLECSLFANYHTRVSRKLLGVRTILRKKTKMRTLLYLCCVMLFSQSTLSAGITLTTSTSQVLSGDLTTATVTVQVRGRSNSGGSENVGFFAFDVTLQPAPGLSITSASYAPVGAPWGNIATPQLTPQVSGNTISFKGGGRRAGPNTVPFNVIVDGTDSLIGSFTFTTTANGNYQVNSTFTSTQRTGIADTTGTINAGLSGFAEAVVSATDNGIALAGNNIGFNNSISVAGITAVPEPSSLLLLGLAGVGIAGHRVRKIRKAKQVA